MIRKFSITNTTSFTTEDQQALSVLSKAPGSDNKDDSCLTTSPSSELDRGRDCDSKSDHSDESVDGKSIFHFSVIKQPLMLSKLLYP